MKNWDDKAKSGTIRSNLPQLSRNAAGKRCGTVETLIAWAWREELPKVPKQAGPRQMASGWMQTERFGEYLSLVDLHGVNEYGAVPDFSADSWPCMDAQIIGRAVMGLNDYALELPEDWRPAPELDGFGGLGAKAVATAWRRMTLDDGHGGQRLRLSPSDIVVHRAVMGYDAEAMAIEDVEQRYEAAGNGKERWFVQRTMDVVVGQDGDGNDITRLETVEVNGWSQRQHRPLPGAYRKPYLDPDPVDAIMARAEHEIWLSALGMVFDQVTHELTDVEMMPSRVPVQPWQGGHEARVLPDLMAQAGLERAERAKVEDAFARRFPRWFKALRRASEKIGSPPA